MFSIALIEHRLTDFDRSPRKIIGDRSWVYPSLYNFSSSKRILFVKLRRQFSRAKNFLLNDLKWCLQYVGKCSERRERFWPVCYYSLKNDCVLLVLSILFFENMIWKGYNWRRRIYICWMTDFSIIGVIGFLSALYFLFL